MRLRGKNEHGDIEGRLRRERPAPSDDLLHRIEAQVEGAPVTRRSRLRVGLAVGFATSLAALLAVLGGASLFGSSAAVEATEFVVPAKAAPALTALKRDGALLASRPALVKRSDGTVSKKLAPRAVVRASGKTSSSSAVPAREASLVRYAADSQYVPGNYVPVCYPIPIGGGNTIWFTIFVPFTSLAQFVPPGVFGLCPS